ncbi:MAG: hypothetical protein EA384_08500 [Spirochaetaceae bacterium]|nr:MAG: hypothetical protein EA384_08500 [Spirochaetaceae bacterium]
MKLSEMSSSLGYTAVQDQFQDRDIQHGYTSDLLSDVMANAAEGSVLITIQAHKNAVAVASMAGIAAIVICNSRPIPDDMLETARSECIAVFTTPKNQFTVSAEVYNRLQAE